MFYGVTARDAPVWYRNINIQFRRTEQSFVLSTRALNADPRIVMRTIPESALYRCSGGLRLPPPSAIGSQIGFRRRTTELCPWRSGKTTSRHCFLAKHLHTTSTLPVLVNTCSAGSYHFLALLLSKTARQPQKLHVFAIPSEAQPAGGHGK
ncbi:hypothetical protein VTO73DRAFT_910 [Trametes versicolor]